MEPVRVGLVLFIYIYTFFFTPRSLKEVLKGLGKPKPDGSVAHCQTYVLVALHMGQQ